MPRYSFVFSITGSSLKFTRPKLGDNYITNRGQRRSKNSGWAFNLSVVRASVFFQVLNLLRLVCFTEDKRVNRFYLRLTVTTVRLINADHYWYLPNIITNIYM